MREYVGLFIANTILALGMIFSLLFGAFTIYRFNSHTYVGNVICLAISLLIVIGLSYTFFCKKNIKFNVALTVLSCFLAIYLAEFILLKIGYASWRWERRMAAYRLGVPFDTRSKLEFINDMRSQGLDMWPAVNPVQLLKASAGLNSESGYIYPLGGLSNKLSTLCGGPGQYVTITTDKHGFNNPNGISGKVEVALIGDSFTEGVCVNYDNSIAGQLRKSGMKVMNFGITGNGPLAELATLKEYARFYQPKVVLWFYFEGNDLIDLAVEKRSPMLIRYLTSDFSQHLIERQQSIDSCLLKYVKKRKFPMWQRFLSLKHLRDLLMPRVEDYTVPAPGQTFRDVLSEAKDTVSGWGGKLYIVYLPDWERYAGYADGKFFHEKEVLSIFAGLKIPVINMADRFDRHADPVSLFPFSLHGHYNPEGYSLVAKEIVNRLHRQAQLVNGNQEKVH